MMQQTFRVLLNYVQRFMRYVATGTDKQTENSSLPLAAGDIKELDTE